MQQHCSECTDSKKVLEEGAHFAPLCQTRRLSLISCCLTAAWCSDGGAMHQSFWLFLRWTLRARLTSSGEHLVLGHPSSWADEHSLQQPHLT
jgi:hypothetical protein